MTIINESEHDLSMILSEASGERSREEVVILAGAGSDRVLPAGTVIAELTAGAKVGKWQELNPGAADGEGEAAGVLIAAKTAPNGVDTKGVVIERDAELNISRCFFPGQGGLAGAITAPQLSTEFQRLDGRGVKLRQSV